MEPHFLNQSSPERRLWAAVVHQAAHDLECPVDSAEYHKAESFFLADGKWAIKRTEIADHLDVHGDDLARYGRRLINARRAACGLPPWHAPAPPRADAQRHATAPAPPPPQQRPAPRAPLAVASPHAADVPLRRAPTKPRTEPSVRHAHAFNPNNPLLRKSFAT